MKNITNDFIPKQVYIAPSMRVVETYQDYSFLTSNLEPIDGGDDPDIDW